MKTENIIALAKIGAVLAVAIYVYKKGVFGMLGDAVGVVGEAVEAVAKPVVEATTKGTSMDVNGSIEIYKENGLTEEQARYLEALALGSMGA